MNRATLAVAIALAATALAAKAGATNYLVASGNDDFTTNGGCSLREALAAATTNAPRDACAAGSAAVADVVQLVSGGYFWTLGPFVIDGGGPLTVRGPASATPTTILDLGDHSRFVTLIGGAALTVERMVVRDGNAFPDTVDPLGGFARVFDSSLTLRDSNFVSNRALRGGVVAFQSGQSTAAPLLVERCQLIGNSADSGGGFTFPQGGALFVSLEGSATARIVDSRFDGNRAVSTVAGDQATGGGFYATAYGAASLELVRLDMEDNVAAPGAGGFSSGAGGTILSGETGHVAVTDTVWTGSDLQGTGLSGSALSLLASGTSTVRIDRARFTGNDVGQPVWQVGLDASGDAEVTLADALVADGSNGGVRARAAESSIVRLGHVTFTGCGTGATLEANDAGVIRIENSLFWNNGEDVVDTIPSAADPSTLRGVDPLFVNPATGDYRLGAGSPAIDFGNRTLPSVGPYDLDHAPRVVGAQTDAGAFERGGLFGDGFESGDRGAWAAVAP